MSGMFAPAGTPVSVNWPFGPVMALAIASSCVIGVHRSHDGPLVKGGRTVPCATLGT